MIRPLILAMFLLPSICVAQQEWAHKAATLDAILAQWDEITKEYNPGISILRPPEKVRFMVKYLSHPLPCDTKLLALVMRQLGVQTFLSQVPVSQCVKVESKTGRTVVVWIQDSLAPDFRADAKINGQVEIYADFLAYEVATDRRRNMPIMLVGRFDS